FHRSPVMVEIEVPAGAAGNEDAVVFTLFVVHHKSGQYSEYWREAESKGVLGLIGEYEKAAPGEPGSVLGDFNAEVTAPSVQNYLSNGFHDLFAQQAPGEGTPPTEFTTHESERRIDLLLLNDTAWSKVVPGSGFVLGTASRPEGVSWRDLESF